jgi:hypothetical protein
MSFHKLTWGWITGCAGLWLMAQPTAAQAQSDFVTSTRSPGQECSLRLCRQDCDNWCWNAIGTDRDSEELIWQEVSCEDLYDSACDSDEGSDEDGEDSDEDRDEDGVSDDDDNCPYDSNEAQRDCDGDGDGDACDEDNSYTYYEGCVPCGTRSGEYTVICQRNYESWSYPMFVYDDDEDEWELCYPWSELQYERTASCD